MEFEELVSEQSESVLAMLSQCQTWDYSGKILLLLRDPEQGLCPVPLQVRSREQNPNAGEFYLPREQRWHKTQQSSNYSHYK